MYFEVFDEIQRCSNLVHEHHKRISVYIESSLLSSQQLTDAIILLQSAGCDSIRASTGKVPASEEHIQLIEQVLGRKFENQQIKTEIQPDQNLNNDSNVKWQNNIKLELPEKQYQIPTSLSSNQLGDLKFEEIQLKPTQESLQKATYKFSFIGSAQCGKTSLINRLLKRDFTNTKPTLGSDFEQLNFAAFNAENVEVNVNLQIIDTAGMEKFGEITQNVLRNCDYCALVFDLHSENTFKALNVWHKLVSQASPGCEFVVVGNKCDLERKVGFEEIQKFAEQIKALCYVECSAKVGYSIQKIIDVDWKVQNETKNEAKQKDGKVGGCC
uniref:Rab-like protein n=1 Tax=Trepomonas sp. PC1 TaxID=1076344 RepID=A0A146KDE7_9EUKA|eukprot:JAP93471.1 Rab-like protein [Trepomonas sp. PC1]